MKISITEFTLETYEEVLALWKSCEGIGLSHSDSEENIRLYLQRNPGMSCIATIDGTIVGAVLAGHDGRRGYMHHLAVSPSHRKKGIGRLLVQTSLAALHRNNILKCHLLLFSHNSDGRKFWESIGWTYRNDLAIMSILIDSPDI